MPWQAIRQAEQLILVHHVELDMPAIFQHLFSYCVERAMAFTPDSKFLITSFNGKLWKISVPDGQKAEIPFTINLNLEFGPRLDFKYPVSDTSHALATQIRDAAPSPDGSKLAFTVLNRLYIMDYPNGIPKRVTTNEFTEANPTWSPDGKQLAFVTWDDDKGGDIYKVNVPDPDLVKDKAPDPF